MVHHARQMAGRKDTSLYGLATHGSCWEFIRLDNDDKITLVGADSALSFYSRQTKCLVHEAQL